MINCSLEPNPQTRPRRNMVQIMTSRFRWTVFNVGVWMVPLRSCLIADVVALSCLWATLKSFRCLDPMPAQRRDLSSQLFLFIKSRNIITATDTLAINHDVGHRPPSCHLAQPCLDLRAEWVKIELNDMRGGLNDVFIEQDAFCELRIWAV